MKQDPKRPDKHIDPATGIWPMSEWGSECTRGFVSDSRFGAGQTVIKRSNRKKTRDAYRQFGGAAGKGTNDTTHSTYSNSSNSGSALPVGNREAPRWSPAEMRSGTGSTMHHEKLRPSGEKAAMVQPEMSQGVLQMPD